MESKCAWNWVLVVLGTQYAVSPLVGTEVCPGTRPAVGA